MSEVTIKRERWGAGINVDMRRSLVQWIASLASGAVGCNPAVSVMAFRALLEADKLDLECEKLELAERLAAKTVELDSMPRVVVTDDDVREGVRRLLGTDGPETIPLGETA